MTHCFDVDIATEYGVTEAILLNRLWFWIEKNRTEERNFFDGRYWTFNSRKALEELFPYLTERKIRNALNHLVEEDILITGRYNKLPFDRTIWYAFTDKGESLMRGELRFREMHLTKSQMTFDKKSDENLTKGQTNTIDTPFTTPIADLSHREQDAKKANVKGNLHSNPSLRPALDEIRAYIDEKGYPVDAESFFNYFTEGEWLDAKGEPVKNWKQKVITWANKSNGKSGYRPPQQSSRRDLFARLYEEHKDDI